MPVDKQQAKIKTPQKNDGSSQTYRGSLLLPALDAFTVGHDLNDLSLQVFQTVLP